MTDLDVRSRVEAVRARIERAGGDLDRIRIVAVTKTFDASAARSAVAAGIADCGESRAQELLGKLPVHGVRWHFVGRLQTNKVRQLADVVSVWQSTDRPELVDEIARRAPGATVLVQVNVSGEEQKGGCHPSEVTDLVAQARDSGLAVAGLMCVPAAATPREGFRLLRSLADDAGLEERSMGMSGDLEVAVEEGSTMVRVGTALFGPRQTA